MVGMMAAMIPAKGYQTLLSAGLYAKYGVLSVQLKPEYVYAANPNFEIFPLTEKLLFRSRSYAYYLNTLIYLNLMEINPIEVILGTK